MESTPPVGRGWSDPAQTDWYLGRIGALEPRLDGERALVEVLPDRPHRVLDLGCGDGRLTRLVMAERTTIGEALAVDSSAPMLARARAALGRDHRVTVMRWDLARSIAPLGRFDLVVSGFAIHHLEDARKRSLFAEIASQLEPDGVFANLEIVASATTELHADFLTAIGRDHDDPEDRLAPVADQLDWMRHAGLQRVRCCWRWRGMALLVGWA